MLLNDEFYTVEEVAKLFKCSKNKVYDLIKKDELKSLEISNMKRIPREEIERITQRREN